MKLLIIVVVVDDIVSLSSIKYLYIIKNICFVAHVNFHHTKLDAVFPVDMIGQVI